MDINLLNGNVLRYKKESCFATSLFWVAQDARGRVWVFEVGERSEVGALESLFIHAQAHLLALRFLTKALFVRPIVKHFVKSDFTKFIFGNF